MLKNLEYTGTAVGDAVVGDGVGGRGVGDGDGRPVVGDGVGRAVVGAEVQVSEVIQLTFRSVFGEPERRSKMETAVLSSLPTISELLLVPSILSSNCISKATAPATSGIYERKAK